jgi:hypothetical protein
LIDLMLSFCSNFTSYICEKTSPVFKLFHVF